MTRLEIIRKNIIDKLLTIDNAELLAAFDKILEQKSEKPISLTDPQKEMLRMSEEDIKDGRVYSQSEVDKKDAEWLN